MKSKHYILSLCIAIIANIANAQGTFTDTVFKKYGITNSQDFINRLTEVNLDIAEKGIILYEPDNRKLLTGYAYNEMYDWDLYFENIYMSYYGVSDFCFSNLKSFLGQQATNGFVSRTLVDRRERQHFKPFFAQIALFGSQQTGNYSWLEERADRGLKQLGPVLKNVSYYDQIALSIDYWTHYCDFDKNGLPVWNSSDHSGMDNQITRAGKLDAFRFEGVDLACYMYRELSAMKILADKLGKANDSRAFDAKAKSLASKINTIFWDEKDGFYYDRDEYTGKLVKVKSVAGFMPLWVGIASPKRADRLVKEHLTNTREFWTEYPVAGYAKTEPDYNNVVKDWGCNWRGTTWIPTNYMIMHGLLDYGYKNIAQQLAQKTLDLVYKKNEVTREYYNGETAGGLGLKRFWGWSALGYLMPFELEMNYNPMQLNRPNKITAIGTDMLGIKFLESTKPIMHINKRLNIK